MASKRARVDSAAEKKENIVNQYLALADADELLEHRQYLTDIIMELTSKPEKISRCKRAVLSDMFLKRPSEEQGSTFGVSCQYMYKIPKEHQREALQDVLGCTAEELRKLEKIKVGTTFRLLCRSVQLEPNSKNPWMVIADWKKNISDRAAKVGGIAIHKGADGSVDWLRTGWFQLVPTIPEDCADVGQHKFTHVALGNVKASLPPYLNVFGDWEVHENWGVQSAIVIMPGKNKKTGPYCKLASCFTEDQLSQALAPPLIVPDDTDSGSPAKGGGGAESAGLASPGASPPTPSPVTKKARKLSTEALKAVIAAAKTSNSTLGGKAANR